MLSDNIIILLFVAALLTVRNTQLQVSMSAYCATVFYACIASASMPAWSDHVIYAALCVPFILVSTMRGAFGLTVYAAFNLVVAVDYIFYPKIATILSSNFTLIHFILAVSLILLSSKKGHNGDNSTVIDNIMDRIGSLWSVQTRLQEMEKRK